MKNEYLFERLGGGYMAFTEFTEDYEYYWQADVIEDKRCSFVKSQRGGLRLDSEPMPKSWYFTWMVAA